VAFRNNEVLCHTSQAMQQTLAVLERQSVQLTEIGKQGEQDSKALKSLTMVATLYLPASLVATVFSSNLITLQPVTTPLVSSHMVVAAQFWVFIVAVMVLMIITLLSIYSLRRSLFVKSNLTRHIG
jgi:Mg2+ and Co2+ transporter CorA